MELGEKLRQARLEAGLSQRQLCGEEITRNMLSQIEHGAAGPSMATLRYLAARLGKPVSYFLEEEVVASPNQSVMEAARQLFDAGDWAGAAEALENYRSPDAVFDREQALLSVLIRLNRAEELGKEGCRPYAREILEGISTDGLYCGEDLERRRLLLLEQADGLPSLDGELLLRAEAALRSGAVLRAGKLLDAAEDQGSPRWNLLRGMACFKEEDYARAVSYLEAAEAAYPRQTIPKLEECFRRLSDYRRAYEYACKGR